MLRREDLADGGLALTVRQYMQPRSPTPGQEGQLIQLVRYILVREGLSYGLYAIEAEAG